LKVAHSIGSIILTVLTHPENHQWDCGARLRHVSWGSRSPCSRANKPSFI